MKNVAEMIRIVSKNNTRQCYTLKCDIRKFFDSVDKDILLGILSKRIKDIKVMHLMREVVDSFVSTYEREREREYFSRAKRYTNR
mgnify:FL=1